MTDLYQELLRQLSLHRDHLLLVEEATGSEILRGNPMMYRRIDCEDCEEVIWNFIEED